MSKPISHVLVTAAKGRLVPVPAAEASFGPLEAGKVYRLPWSTYTRRRLAAGDLVLVNAGGTAVKTPEEARADLATKILGDGTLDTDQRTDEEINAAAAAAPRKPGKDL